MKFIATAKGFIHDSIVNPGESFEEADDFSCGWAVPAKDYEPEVETRSEAELQEEAREGLQGSKKKASKKKAKKKVAKKTAKD